MQKYSTGIGGPVPNQSSSSILPTFRGFTDVSANSNQLPQDAIKSSIIHEYAGRMDTSQTDHTLYISILPALVFHHRYNLTMEPSTQKKTVPGQYFL